MSQKISLLPQMGPFSEASAESRPLVLLLEGVEVTVNEVEDLAAAPFIRRGRSLESQRSYPHTAGQGPPG